MKKFCLTREEHEKKEQKVLLKLERSERKYLLNSEGTPRKVLLNKSETGRKSFNEQRVNNEKRGESVPKLSIIIPVYNVEDYIVECLDSIGYQTFKDFEVLLVDDGSTDKSGTICSRYARRDERFKYFYQENKGVSAARNLGIDNAIGDFISFVDPDDVIAINYYACMFRTQEKYSADIVQGEMVTIDETGTVKKEQHNLEMLEKLLAIKHETVVAVGTDEIMNCVTENTFNCLSWGKIFKRTLFGEKRFPYELSLGEDMAIVPGIVASAKIAVRDISPVYYYRIRKKSLLHGTVSVKRFREDLRGSEAMRESLVRISEGHKEDIELLKLQCDLGCIANYFQSNRNKSILFNACSISDDLYATSEFGIVKEIANFFSGIKHKTGIES